MTVSHRKSNIPEYNIWVGIKVRCYNPNVHTFQYYGGRGIVMCDRWRDSFENFYADMGPRPSAQHSIDRIDCDGPYSPENCRWATKDEQANNMHTNRLITYNGVTQSVSDWAKQLGIPYNRLRARILNGMTVEQALSGTDFRNVHPVTFQGETRSIAEWSRFTGLSESVISDRLLDGWTVERALTTPQGPYPGKMLTYNGQTKNISDWAAELGLSVNAFSKRIRKGWSIEKAITTPPRTDKITRR